jgi:hypothetical protein
MKKKNRFNNAPQWGKSSLATQKNKQLWMETKEKQQSFEVQSILIRHWGKEPQF